MNDDSIKTDGGNDDVSNTNVGDEPEFTSAEKVFDITSDLNIMPVSEVTAAEEAKEKDVPIANFAEKIAAQTKNARIYREGSVAQKKPEPVAPAPIKTEPKIEKPEEPKLEIPNIPPEIQAKYHTSNVVQTAPWVKNKPIETKPISNEPAPSTVANTDTTAEKPKSNIPLADIDNMVKNAKRGPANNLGSRIFALRGVPKEDEQKFQPPTKVVGNDMGADIETDSAQDTNNKTETGGTFGNSIKPMRTYEGDVAEMMSKKKPSTTSIAIAESKKLSGEESVKSLDNTESSHTIKKIIMILLSLIMIGAGVTGAYYLYMKSPLAPVTVINQIPKINSLIPNDEQVLLSIDGLKPLDIQYKIQNEVSKGQNPDTIKEIVLTKTNNNVKTRVSGPEIIEAIDLDMPDVLRRSIDNAWMLGVYTNSNGEKDIFVALTNNFFQNVFAGMLQWESVMADDIKQYLLPVAPLGIANIPDIDVQKIINPLENLDSILPKTDAPTTTASSTNVASTSTTKNISVISTSTATTTSTTTIETESINPYFTIRGKFEDRIIRNKDVRAFRTIEDNILFLYSFIDNQRLIITTKESTLDEIIQRIEKEAFVR